MEEVKKIDRIKTFLAYSAVQEDREVVNFFLEFFSHEGFDLIKKELPPSPDTSLTKSILEDIKKCAVFIGILTKRHKLPGGKYLPSMWELLEVIFQFTHKEGYFSAVFVENNVEIPQIKLEELTSVHRFSRNKLTGYLPTLYHISANLKEQIRKNPGKPLAVYPEDWAKQPLSLSRTVKTIIIRPNGHGVINYRHDLQIESATFKEIPFPMRFNVFAPSKTGIPNKVYLCSTVREPFNENSFSFRLLYPKNIIYKIIDKGWDRKDRRRTLAAVLDPPLNRGDDLSFAWSWSSPGLFSVNGNDRSEYLCDHDTKDLSFAISFELPRFGSETAWHFENKPVLIVRDPRGAAYSMEQPRRDDEVGFIKFKWENLQGHSGFNYHIDWSLR